MMLRALPLYAPRSGLRISAGRIDGSLFGRLRIHDLALADPAGVFARAPLVDLDWRPFDLIDHRLDVRAVTVPDAVVLRRPHLRPSADRRVLPDIDIVVGRLRIDRLVFAAPVAGVAGALAVAGTADIRSGRALVDLSADAAGGGDHARLHLDARPDRDRLDLDARVEAAAGGIVGRLLGLGAPLDLRVGGAGQWSAWNGHAVARLGTASLADLAIAAHAGRFAVSGRVAPSLLLKATAARLAGPAMTLRLDARLADRTVTATLAAASPAVQLTAAGTIDFGDERFDHVIVDAHLLRPAVANPRLGGRDIRLAAKVGGSFVAPVVDYALTAPVLNWGATGFDTFRASGSIAAGHRPLVIPVTATAARVTNVGADIAPLLARLQVTGPLTLDHGSLASDRLIVRTARIDGIATVRLRLADGDYGVGFDGRLPRYAVGTIGVADVTTQLRATPSAPGGGTRVTGTVRAVATRLDSGFFQKLFGGLPVLTTGVEVAPDLSMRFAGLKIAGPALTIAGGGTRAPDASVRLTGAGVSRDYGPASVVIAGPLDQPVVDVALARPGLGIGLAAVTAHVTPAGTGWEVAAQGASSFGRAGAHATIRDTATGSTIDLGATAAGITARGVLVPTDAGPVTGRLALTGNGLGGTVVLAAAGTDQRADVALTATDAKLPMATVGRGTASAAIVFGDAMSITGRFAGSGIRLGGMTLTSASGSVVDDRGRGHAALAVGGIAGTPFTAGATLQLTPDRLDLRAEATIDGKHVTLDHPARIDRDGATWRLAPVTLVTPDGRATLAGSYGDVLAVDARLDNLGLGLLGAVERDLDFGGHLSGSIAFTVPAGGSPVGKASLRVAGLTRAGLAATSLPIDVGINAAIGATGASARAVIARGGTALGRVQADLRLDPAVGALSDRLLAAPLFAQARYTGPAQALWLLGGVEAIDVRGPLVIAVDIAGRLGNPSLSGTVRASGGRFENTTLGTVIDNVEIDSRFAGSRLDLTRFAGTVGKDGRISGTGNIDLSAEGGFPIDLRLQLDNAQMLNRDDLRATASGGLRLQSDRSGGRITGKLTIARARYRLGRAGGADVPVVAVTERNVELLGRTAPRTARPTPWLLDVAATATKGVQVIGLGLDSEWRGDIHLGGPATQPDLTGRVRLVRGDYDFSGKRFTLTRGDLRFAGGNPPDPVIDVAAENTSSGFTAQLSLTGTGLHPEIKFGSTPSLPEDEVLSRVLFGTSITTLSAPEALQLAGALASLRSGKSTVLNPIDAVRKGLRIDRLRILPADITTGRKTSIAAGQYIGRRLYVELSTDAQGYSASAIEVALSRSLSILSDVATLGGTSVNLRLKKDY
ncbi:MAG: translocation/assembly module TamB domain-containing protein [Janthinobacterium lividum]